MILADSLSTRITRILLAGAAAVLAVVALALAWPAPEGGVGFFRLPRPAESAAIVAAVEASGDESRPAVIGGLDAVGVGVRLSPTFPRPLAGARRMGPEDDRYQSYAATLGGRSFQLEERRLLRRASGGRPRAVVRLSVRLADGEVLVIQRRPPAAARGRIVRGAMALSLIALLMLAMLALAVRQTTRPVARLAQAARQFGDDLQAAELPLRGPRELRDLAEAFNTMQARIRALVDDRTRVLAAIAHDLRTYLTRLRLRAEFIIDPDQQARAIRDLDEMSALLDDTLLFAAGQGEAKAPLSDLRAELEGLIALRQEMGQAVRLTEGATAFARVSPLALRRMVGNLVDNAVRYGGDTEVALERAGDQAVIIVADRGPGVAADDLARITEPFARLETSRSRDTGGAGLGLAIVRGLAEASGGRLEMSHRQGGGLQAELSLPLAE
ncbi:ATP-binding protein [Phenylobacterium sp.]|uniref:ATP-binding protein n=1 Tax=Phenylobacterium sp. TaxID=1871053 RepID=UPI00272FAD2B|nr:ATP-binding protein [Phenylobacterium sp.]MDP1619303.1 ATP-binding protein [Phenylobacterium sp.]MDP1987900.1 ATP-binding protein [Phenylobacterium sp.]